MSKKCHFLVTKQYNDWLIHILWGSLRLVPMTTLLCMLLCFINYWKSNLLPREDQINQRQGPTFLDPCWLTTLILHGYYSISTDISFSNITSIIIKWTFSVGLVRLFGLSDVWCYPAFFSLSLSSRGGFRGTMGWNLDSNRPFSPTFHLLFPYNQSMAQGDSNRFFEMSNCNEYGIFSMQFLRWKQFLIPLPSLMHPQDSPAKQPYQVQLN